MPLPTTVSYGVVKGRFIAAVIDGADSDRYPDGLPLTGLTIKFEPSVRMVKAPTATPPVTLFLDTIVCTTDTNGDLVDSQGTPGVYLVATNDPDLTPVNWTYKVTINGGTGSLVPPQEFNISVPSGADLDITTLIPVPPNVGQAIADWQKAIDDTFEARDDVYAAIDEVGEAIDDLAALDATLAAAQTARTGAETAQTGAQTARTGAETALASANTAKTAAETAKTGAETARTGAETAKTAAETAQGGAQAARTGAESARDEATVTVTNLGTISTAQTLTQAQTRSKYIKATLAANVTFTLAAGVTGVAYSCVLRLQQDNTTNGRVAVFANVSTPYGGVLPYSNVANAVDRVVLEWDGAQWSAYLSGPQMSVPPTWVV